MANRNYTNGYISKGRDDPHTKHISQHVLRAQNGHIPHSLTTNITSATDFTPATSSTNLLLSLL